MILLLVVLTVGWVVVTAYNGWWAILAVGTTLLGLVLAGVVIYLLLTIKEIRLNQRQSNFMDSVTHELKSPIASLKLYLQTLTRRQVSDEEQADFHRFMLEDLDRLDRLISHMLDAARLDQKPVAQEVQDVELCRLLEQVTDSVCVQHRVPASSVRLNATPAVVRGRPLDIEILLRNLIDNAIKYSGERPEVEVACHPLGLDQVQIRVSDNGPGIPVGLRRKIFGRFVRLGNELEREQQGTGLGLFIVRNVVRRMRGKVNVRSRGSQPGTTFEVILPGKALVQQEQALKLQGAAAPGARAAGDSAA
jgi:signal transduction histidine kinase